MESTKGIVLHYYKYSESSVIVKIFTEESGLQTYVLKGVRNKKSKNKVNLLQALNLVNMEASNISKRNKKRNSFNRVDGKYKQKIHEYVYC